MTKDSTELEYKGEIYGRIWEAITWDKEEREYQHLTNALFMAAKEDIIAEKNKLHRYDRKTQDVSQGWGKVEVRTLNNEGDVFTKNLEKVIGEFCKDVDQKKRKEAEENLKDELLPSYKALKDRLNDVRVRGVENSSLEAAGKACKICLKTMIVAVAAVATTLNIASIFTPAMPVVVVAAAAGAGIASGVAMSFAGNDSEILMNIRENMKKTLKETKGSQEPKLDSGSKSPNPQKTRWH